MGDKKRNRKAFQINRGFPVFKAIFMGNSAKTAFLLILVLSNTACLAGKTPAMDELAEDGKYHYLNKDLAFKIEFPASFFRYQVQRKNIDEYIELEFYVPTADTGYPQEIQSYAEAVVVRVYESLSWKDYDKKDYIKDVYYDLGEHNGYKYFVRFWDTRPSDWQDQWSQETEKEIINSFAF